MDNEQKVAAELKHQLISIYNRLKTEKHEIDAKKIKYLGKIAGVCSTTLFAANADESIIMALAKLSAPQMLEMSRKGVLTNTELDDIVHEINHKAKELVGASTESEQPGAGNGSREDSADPGKGMEDGEEPVPFIKKELIPVGFEENSPKISVEDFFSFPLNVKSDPSDQQLYEQHIKYLAESVEQSSLDKEDFERIKQVMDTLPKHRYKKYFDVYPGGVFEEATLSMLYIKLRNKTLERLRVSPVD